MLVAGLEPARGCPRGILSPLRLPIPPHQRTHCVILYCMDLRAKHCSIELINATGWRWIRTTEAICSRFTVCPLWPLGNPSIFFLFDGTNRARTYDLRVMSPTSFQTAPPRDIMLYMICSLLRKYSRKRKWMEVDSNHRSNLQQIYSLSPLATRESIHMELCSIKPMIGLEPITC